jgi:RNA polymerase sigma-70 factor (ECF subfamily)
MADSGQAGRPREELLDLYAAVERLEERQKTVVLLKYVGDMTLKEVAETLQWPLGTVKTHLHKALQELRVELKEDSEYGQK